MPRTSNSLPALSALAGSLALSFALLSSAHAAAPNASGGIDWKYAGSDAEVDKAFALSKKTGKPVFFYWGAVWCPPCNQVKATLFSRPDFVERSRAFIPVYVDGDKAGAQKVASRFKVEGYPTMVVFKPDGTEITRLPGEVDPERYLLTLTAGLNAQVPVKDLVAKALAKGSLTPEQWRLLAFYSWDQQLVLPAADLPKRLHELAVVVPTDLAEVRDRLELKALIAGSKAKAEMDASSAAAARQLTERLLADPASARRLSDILVGYAETITKHIAPAGEARKALALKFESALARLQQDQSLSRGERVDVLDAQVSTWKVIDDTPQLSAQRQKVVLREAALLVQATKDKYERQAVVPGAAYVLGQSGLFTESNELLKMELPRAVAPYYHMLALGSNAKKQKDAKTALYWYEQAWRKSEGPATKIQWGTGYVRNAVELAPEDSARIEAAASGVITQLEPKGETFFERNQRSLKLMATSLTKWQGSDAARTKVVEKVKQQLAKTCAKLPAADAGRGNCEKVFTPDSA
ncbi:MAG TPA: thioredoxin fold domain-containing protein [Ramlibacter sp.]|nr:thioredoxin fold domain-containing protein [Ramlibacter sp.]